MDNDERDRRDLPEEDRRARAEEPAEPTRPTEPPVAREPEWPAEEPVDQTTRAEQPTPQTPTADETAPWPTRAPERGEAPVVDGSSRTDDEPPPSEVEAYPAEPAPPPVREDGEAAVAAAPAHSVPAAESATGESTQCPRCGTENRPGLAFCRNCGQRLVAAGAASTVERPGTPEGTQACPRCGTHNRAGVAFCQNCGANLRGTGPGYVPPAAAREEAAEPVAAERRGAVLGPVVLLIGLIGITTAYLLPFPYGTDSLFERALGTDGYGLAFWAGYPEVNAALADQAYFGLAAPSPLLGVLLVALAVAGFMRAAPGTLQVVGLVVALLWSVGLVLLFVIVEVAANWGGDIVGLLRDLSPGGIIFFLAGLIVLIGALTRFGRS